VIALLKFNTFRNAKACYRGKATLYAVHPIPASDQALGASNAVQGRSEPSCLQSLIPTSHSSRSMAEKYHHGCWTNMFPGGYQQR